MKKIHLVLLLSICFYYLNGQNSNDITIGKVEKLHSKILNEEREIWIHVPGENASDMFEKKNYPVVYLLDGDAHFYSVVGMLHQLSSVNGNAVCPQMIVVGIPNTNRARDLTPSKAIEGHPYTNSAMVAASGGGDQFISFMEKELMPYIESNYPTEPYRMFIGHSLGGLMVVNTLIHRPELFNSFISIDPSMWWSDKQLLNEIKNTELDEKYSGKSLFLGIANTMSEGMDIESVRRDTSFSTEHIRSILELDALLNSDSQKQIAYKGKYYEDDDHSSAVLITEYDAIRFIFDFFQLEFEPEDYSDPDSDILIKVEEHYKRLSKVFGTEMKPDEQLINELGYRFINMEQFEKAEVFFKLNVENYPTSFNVFDSLGDYYLAIGKKKKAIKNFKKSIELNKDSYSKEKLIELQND